MLLSPYNRAPSMNVPRAAHFFLAPILLAAAVALSGIASAESLLPLETEEAKPLPSGSVEMVAGVSYFRNLRFPEFTAAGAIHEQDLIKGPQIAFRIGAGDWAEIQASYEFISIDEDTIAGHHDKYGGGDARLHTKVRLLREQGYWPGLGIRFGTKLPTSSKSSGLGLGTTDFFAGILLAKTVRSVRTVGNVSLLVLGNPVAAQDPLRAIGLGLSVARAITNEFEAVGEVNGHMEPFGSAINPGLESRGVFRLAGRYTHDLLRFDLGLLVGMTSRDPSFGVSAGATYVFGR